MSEDFFARYANYPRAVEQRYCQMHKRIERTLIGRLRAWLIFLGCSALFRHSERNSIARLSFVLRGKRTILIKSFLCSLPLDSICGFRQTRITGNNQSLDGKVETYVLLFSPGSLREASSCGRKNWILFPTKNEEYYDMQIKILKSRYVLVIH